MKRSIRNDTAATVNGVDVQGPGKIMNMAQDSVVRKRMTGLLREFFELPDVGGRIIRSHV